MLAGGRLPPTPVLRYCSGRTEEGYNRPEALMNLEQGKFALVGCCPFLVFSDEVQGQRKAAIDQRTIYEISIRYQIEIFLPL